MLSLSFLNYSLKSVRLEFRCFFSQCCQHSHLGYEATVWKKIQYLCYTFRLKQLKWFFIFTVLPIFSIKIINSTYKHSYSVVNWKYEHSDVIKVILTDSPIFTPRNLWIYSCTSSLAIVATRETIHSSFHVHTKVRVFVSLLGHSNSSQIVEALTLRSKVIQYKSYKSAIPQIKKYAD